MNKNLLSLLAIAVFVGLVGLYAIFGDNGNAPSGPEVATDATSVCPAALARAQELKTVATGDVAAFRIASEAINVSDLSFQNSSGKTVSLANWQGKTVLFNLWATWCPPCREEMPWLRDLQANHGNEAFEVVAVSIDEKEAVAKQFYADEKLEALAFHQDASSDVFFRLKKEGIALGMPTTMIVDPNGCVLGVLNGPAHWSGADAVRLIGRAAELSQPAG